MQGPTSQPRTWYQRLFISTDEPRLRAGWRLLGQTVLMILAIGALSWLSFLLTFPFDGFPVRLDLLLTIISSATAIVASIYISRRFLDQRTFVSLGQRLDKQAFLDILSGFLLSAVMLAILFFLEWAGGWLQVESFAWSVERWPDILASLGVMLLVFGVASWSEELLARGYWLQNLSEGLNLFLGVLLSSILFSIAHAYNANVSWQAYLGLFFSGLFFAFCYLRTRQLWLSIGVHLGWNFFEGNVFGFPVSGAYYYQLIRQSSGGPELITGGAFGPEGGLILLPVLLIGTFIVILYTWDRTKEMKTSSREEHAN
jgi:membrane protease YdiL (CAAX protease family)